MLPYKGDGAVVADQFQRVEESWHVFQASCQQGSGPSDGFALAHLFSGPHLLHLMSALLLPGIFSKWNNPLTLVFILLHFIAEELGERAVYSSYQVSKHLTESSATYHQGSPRTQNEYVVSIYLSIYWFIKPRCWDLFKIYPWSFFTMYLAIFLILSVLMILIFSSSGNFSIIYSNITSLLFTFFYFWNSYYLTDLGIHIFIFQIS